jgi:hypothetical protein
MIDKIIYVIVGAFVIFAVLGFGLIILANDYTLIDRFFNAEKYNSDDDKERIEHFEYVKTALEKAAVLNSQTHYCLHGENYCEGKTNEDGAGNTDGTGWVKVDLRGGTDPASPAWLPTGFYNEEYFYKYCSDNKDWEIETKLRSKNYAFKAEKDGGSDPKMYEVGTNLNICR